MSSLNSIFGTVVDCLMCCIGVRDADVSHPIRLLLWVCSCCPAAGPAAKLLASEMRKDRLYFGPLITDGA